MPRDSSGSYSLPSGTIVSAGDNILPSQHNPAFLDVAQAIGSSLSRDGIGGMRATLDMGANVVRNAAAGTLDNDLVTKAQLAQVGIPVGSIIAYAGVSTPTGFILCDGRAVSRTDYAALFVALATYYGAGDGSTTFNVPDMRGNVMVGQDNMGGTAAGRLTGANSIGVQMGAQAVTLTEAQMPTHGHGVTDPGHHHGYTGPLVAGAGVQAGSAVQSFTTTTGDSVTGISIQTTGGSQAHPNVQPSLVTNFLIKALN